MSTDSASGALADAVIGRVRAVLTGRVAALAPQGPLSAMAKQPRDGPVLAGGCGLEGDAQADLRVHGGPDKAVHVYPWAHYRFWREQLAGNAAARALLDTPGAFGENLSVDAPDGGALDETMVCLGDRWRIGPTAQVEVSQGRQPCWKLNVRLQQRDVAALMQKSLRAGWYLRVLQPGLLRAGDAITLLARPHPDWPLARLLRCIAEREAEPATLGEILALPLTPSWRKLFARRLASGEAESWSARLRPPA